MSCPKFRHIPKPCRALKNSSYTLSDRCTLKRLEVALPPGVATCACGWGHILSMWFRNKSGFTSSTLVEISIEDTNIFSKLCYVLFCNVFQEKLCIASSVKPENSFYAASTLACLLSIDKTTK